MTSGGNMTQGRIARVLVILAGFFAVAANANQFPAVPGEYIVKLKSGVVTKRAGELKALGMQRQVLPQHGIALVQRPLVEKSETALNVLNNNPLIEYAEPNFIYTVNGGSATLPNDPKLPQLWGMINDGTKSDGDQGQVQGKAGIDIDAARAWQIETGSRNIIVAVIDTGVNYRNPDLAPNIFVNAAEQAGAV
jgi:thermitase